MENSVRSSSKGAKLQKITGFALINDDLLQNILSRLPAVSFASASFVSKSWNRVCYRVLSRPKLVSALSLNPSPRMAVREVLDKVLAEPIKPHFVIANVGKEFRLSEVSRLISKRLGSKTPTIVSIASGIIGRDAQTDEFKEVQWIDTCGELSDGDGNISADDVDYGVVLTVGYLPGIKVEVIPMLGSSKEPQDASMEKFVQDIREFTVSASGSATPIGIILFGEARLDMKPIVSMLDCAMPLETFIVGNERVRFSYKSLTDYNNLSWEGKCSAFTVGLVLARDRYKSDVVGNVEFHVAFSDGVSAVGPRYKAASVREKCSGRPTWLTARIEGQQEVLDGQRILSHINTLLENLTHSPDLYVGVTKRRHFSFGSEKPRLRTSLEYHGVVGGNEEYLHINGSGIRTGDAFQLYRSDPDVALSTLKDVSLSLKNLRLDEKQECCPSSVNSIKKQVFGGLIFSCHGRGESFFGRTGVDSSPLLESFPGASLAGVFCGGEIARGSVNVNGDGKKIIDVRCYLRVYSTVYVVMSYTPSPLEH